MKRPFGSGAFARGRGNSPEVRGSGQRSLTPWPMSKYVNVDEKKRGRDKRPFGPGAFSRPSSQRVGKRPFGGGVIFSRPRDEGNAKLNYGRYGYSRQRREPRFDDSPPPNAAFRDGRHDGRSFREAILDGDDEANAWVMTVEDLPLGRSLYSSLDGRSNDEYDVEYYDKDPRDDGQDTLETKREIKKQNTPGTFIDDKRMAG